jgi:hypothetical protein
MLGLAASMFATLVQQWARQYDRAIASLEKPREKGRMRAFLRAGLEHFHFNVVVDALPTILHIAVFLFFAGLVEFLFDINKIVAWFAVVIVVLCSVAYALVSLQPIVSLRSPYRTAQ